MCGCRPVVVPPEPPCRVWWCHCCTLNLLQVDTVVELCLQALSAGMCPVIGLQSTGEARTAAFVKAAQADKEQRGAWRVGGGGDFVAWGTSGWMAETELFQLQLQLRGCLSDTPACFIKSRTSCD